MKPILHYMSKIIKPEKAIYPGSITFKNERPAVSS